MNNLAYSLKELLISKGYSLSDEDIVAAVEYIEMSGPEYTIFQWLEDTKTNYPEFLEVGAACFEN